MKLSVAMITYNHERFISQAIESALSQKADFDFEIVIGEDSSTDRTRELVADFQRRHPQRIVALLRSHNLGAMRNLQETLGACKGEYVAFLEGDDYWTCEDKLQKQVSFLDSHPECALSCHRARYVYETHVGSTAIAPTRPAGAYNLDDLLADNFMMTCSAVCRWGLLGRLPDWFHGLELADWPMFALLASKGTIELMDDVMAAYRVHPGGVWSGSSETRRLREAIRMLGILESELPAAHANTIRKTIAQYYLRMAEVAQREGGRANTAMYVLNCLRSGGANLPGSRPVLRGLFWYTILGGWHLPLARAKRAILR